MIVEKLKDFYRCRLVVFVDVGFDLLVLEIIFCKLEIQVSFCLVLLSGQSIYEI